MYYLSNISWNESENQTLDETDNLIIHITIRTLADLERFMSVYLNTTTDSYLQLSCNLLILLKVYVIYYILYCVNITP